MNSLDELIQQDESKLNDWLIFFLESLVSQKNALGRKVERERLMSGLPELSEELIKIIKEHGRLTVSTAVSITGKNRNTIRAHLKKLVEIEKILQRGKGKGTWYSMP